MIAARRSCLLLFVKWSDPGREEVVETLVIVFARLRILFPAAQSLSRTTDTGQDDRLT